MHPGAPYTSLTHPLPNSHADLPDGPVLAEDVIPATSSVRKHGSPASQDSTGPARNKRAQLAPKHTHMSSALIWKGRFLTNRTLRCCPGMPDLLLFLNTATYQ